MKLGWPAKTPVAIDLRLRSEYEAPPLLAEFVRTEREKSLEELRHLCVANRPNCFDHGN